MTFLFIDADILLDVILNRAPHYTSSAGILALTEEVEFVCCTTVHTLLSVHAVTENHQNKAVADKAIELLTGKLQIIVEGKEVINQALAANFTNLEDAVKHFAAVNAGCEFIVSRNVNNYINSSIPVLAPEQFLNTVS